MDWRVTVVSSNFISLLLIISISLTIHLIVRYQELYEINASATRQELVSMTITQMLKPCFYCFNHYYCLCLFGVSEIKPVIDFGKMMVAGIFFAFYFRSFFSLFSCSYLLPRKVKNREILAKE